MMKITLLTEIYAPVEKCFDMARSIDVHLSSMKGTGERAIAGRTSGLCELNDEVTWQATHFGIRQKLTSKITGFNRPSFFEDTMQKGAFKSLRHEHYFKEQNGVTTMSDIFMYEVPLGLLGKLFDTFILRNYMTRVLTARNNTIKQLAEEKRA
jgi:ligand-binding SRPBCC domain-containing protein